MIIVDSNIWVFAEVESAPEHSAAAATLRDALSTEGVGLNVLVASEVFHALRPAIHEVPIGSWDWAAGRCWYVGA